MISVVAYSLIEEAPHDIYFFYKISGWNELILMTLIFLTTFLWNLRIGIAVGIGLSLLRLLHHSTRPRIQILGRIPGTTEFENAEFVAGERPIEFVPTLPNRQDPGAAYIRQHGARSRTACAGWRTTARAMRTRPYRAYATPSTTRTSSSTSTASPRSIPRRARCSSKSCRTMSSAARGVFFCRVPGRQTEVWRLMRVSRIVEICGGERQFLRSVDEALRATDRTPSTLVGEEDEAPVDEQTQTEGEDAR